MGGFAMALGGALGGLGQGIVLKAKAEREEHLEELRAQRRAQELKDDQNFRKTEAEDRRKFDTDEREASQKFATDEAEKKRKADEAASGDVLTTEDGTTLVRRGTTAVPLEVDGKPVKQKDKDKPTAAEIEKMVETTLKTELGDMYVPNHGDPEELSKLDARRDQIRERLKKQLGAETPVSRPEGASDAELLSEAKTAIAGGANRQSVIDRLKKLGIDTSGL